MNLHIFGEKSQFYSTCHDIQNGRLTDQYCRANRCKKKTHLYTKYYIYWFHDTPPSLHFDCHCFSIYVTEC